MIACRCMSCTAAHCINKGLVWQVFAQRRPILHKLLDWEDELFALITAFLDRQSLASSSSTFADSLYGLRRAPYVREGPSKSLTEQQQKVTLLLLVREPTIVLTHSSFMNCQMHTHSCIKPSCCAGLHHGVAQTPSSTET